MDAEETILIGIDRESWNLLKTISVRSGISFERCLREAIEIYAETLAQGFV